MNWEPSCPSPLKTIRCLTFNTCFQYKLHFGDQQFLSSQPLSPNPPYLKSGMTDHIQSLFAILCLFRLSVQATTEAAFKKHVTLYNTYIKNLRNTLFSCITSNFLKRVTSRCSLQLLRCLSAGYSTIHSRTTVSNQFALPDCLVSPRASKETQNIILQKGSFYIFYLHLINKACTEILLTITKITRSTYYNIGSHVIRSGDVL